MKNKIDPKSTDPRDLINTLVSEMISRYLIDRNKDGRTVLHDYLLENENPNIEIIKLLLGDLNIQDKEGYTPLHCYFLKHKNPDIEIIKLLIGDLNIQDKNGYTPLHLYIFHYNPDIEIINLLKGNLNIRDKDGCTPLYLYLWRHEDRRIKKMKSLKELNYRIEEDTLTPLNIEIIKSLIGNLNIRDTYFRYTPLERYIRNNTPNIEIIKLLKPKDSILNFNDIEIINSMKPKDSTLNLNDEMFTEVSSDCLLLCLLDQIFPLEDDYLRNDKTLAGSFLHLLKDTKELEGRKKILESLEIKIKHEFTIALQDPSFQNSWSDVPVKNNYSCKLGSKISGKNSFFTEMSKSVLEQQFIESLKTSKLARLLGEERLNSILNDLLNPQLPFTAELK